MKRWWAMLALLLLTGCAAREVPQREAPQLAVYVVEEGVVRQMDVESYVAGVVAGEMRSDWPPAALEAQAILARTFVMKFVSEKESRYPGADISTDVAEAQAYNAPGVTDAIRGAVERTSGQVLVTADDRLPYTWFHAHSGGVTALAREGVDWQGAEPSHTLSTAGLDSPDAPPEAAAWSAEFPAEVFLAACRDAGSPAKGIGSVRIKQKGDSGRAVTLEVDGVEVNAARLRMALGSTVMRSTLLTELASDGRTVRMQGRGYGHGVGMPQWGAYRLAREGWSGAEIALHYYKGLRLVQLW